MTVLAYITDLFLQAKISQAAQEAGAHVQMVSSIYKFLPALNESPNLVIVDLSAQGISATSLIAQVKSRGGDMPVLAFAPANREDLMQRARDAGADQVMSRSDLSDDLGDFVARWARPTD